MGYVICRAPQRTTQSCVTNLHNQLQNAVEDLRIGSITAESCINTHNSGEVKVRADPVLVTMCRQNYPFRRTTSLCTVLILIYYCTARKVRALNQLFNTFRGVSAQRKETGGQRRSFADGRRTASPSDVRGEIIVVAAVVFTHRHRLKLTK